MLPDSTIATWRKRTGTTGAGEPVFTAATVAHPIPCQMIQPSSVYRASERAAGLEVSRVVTVPASALGGLTPEIGDRLTIARVRTPSVLEELDIVEAREQPDEAGPVWEMKFGTRLDSESGGGA